MNVFMLPFMINHTMGLRRANLPTSIVGTTLEIEQAFYIFITWLTNFFVANRITFTWVPSDICEDEIGVEVLIKPAAAVHLAQAVEHVGAGATFIR